MRIGLLRHFPVAEPLPTGWRNMAELMAWRVRYEASPPVVGEADAGAVAWSACLSSDARRARETAVAAFAGPIEFTPLLREAEFREFNTGRLRLPASAWRWLFQLAWWAGHASQRECRDDFLARMRTVAERLDASAGDVLVVSHAGMMVYLSAELRRRGFRGRSLRMPRCAQLYVYER